MRLVTYEAGAGPRVGALVDGGVADMGFFGALIAYAARSQTLHPGEVIGSGTAPGGSGLELDRRLEPGDVIEMEVEGIGLLRNTIGRRGA